MTSPAHRQALHWQVCFWSGEMTAAEQQAFEGWLAEDPAHRLAWQKVQEAGRRLTGRQLASAEVDPALIGRVLQGARGMRRERRRVLYGLLLMTGVVGVGQHVAPWQRWTGDQRAARGERKTVALADGGALVLNSASAVDIDYGAALRRVILREGEIYVSTAPDHAAIRPFVVDTPHGQVRALGTRFGVRLLPHGVQVAVYEGAVAIRPSAVRNDRDRQLDAGWRAFFNRSHVDEASRELHHAPPWSAGRLAAEGMTLADFLAELGRYRSGVLRCQPEIANLRISGVYPLDDTDHVLSMLTQVLPVQVVYRTPYWVTVVPRHTAS